MLIKFHSLILVLVFHLRRNRTEICESRTKWGVYRPYLLFGNIPLALSFVLLFWVPPLEGEDMVGNDRDSDDNFSDSTENLLLEGIEKRSALIVVQGPFRNVQAFLQDLESLEVFVIASDLSMEAIRQSANETGNEALVQTKLELQLSAYGRVVTPIINDIDVMSEVSQ